MDIVSVLCGAGCELGRGGAVQGVVRLCGARREAEVQKGGAMRS